MKHLPQIPTPDDFDNGVHLRVMLSSLPVPTLDAGFENAVLKRARGRNVAKWAVVSGGLAVAVSGWLYVAFTPSTDVVRVVSVPVIKKHIANVENIPPAPAHRYTVYPGSTPSTKRPEVVKDKGPWAGRPKEQ